MGSPIKGGEVSDRMKWGLIAVLVLGWTINMVVPLIVHDYKSPPEVHAAFMSVVAVLAAHKTKNGGDPP